MTARPGLGQATLRAQREGGGHALDGLPGVRRVQKRRTFPTGATQAFSGFGVRTATRTDLRCALGSDPQGLTPLPLAREQDAVAAGRPADHGGGGTQVGARRGRYRPRAGDRGSAGA